MPVKSAHVKKIKTKIDPAVEKDDASEEMIPKISMKTRMPIEMDEPETASPLDEKPEDETTGTDEESDELGLDDSGLEEELDPFNDKWEA